MKEKNKKWLLIGGIILFILALIVSNVFLKKQKLNSKEESEGFDIVLEKVMPMGDSDKGIQIFRDNNTGHEYVVFPEGVVKR